MSQSENIQAYQVYTIATSGWLTLKALFHLLTPKLLLMTLNDEPRLATHAEIHLTRSVGLAILSIAFLALFLSGLIPLGSSNSNSTADQTEASSPYIGVVIKLTTLYHSTAAFQSYTAYARYGSASLGFSTLASCALSAIGLWCIMFEGGGHVSRRTGRDKRTSGWPFRNKEAAKYPPK